MGKLLWTPSQRRIEESKLTRFTEFVNSKFGLEIKDYWELYRWSIERIPNFWAAMWDFFEIKASHKYEAVVEDLDKFPGAKWFPGARLNFAENLLRRRDDHHALIFKDERGTTKKVSYEQLNSHVARLAEFLRQNGIRPGDRVSAYMPNLIETVAAMLAATSIGAAWASCGAELGPTAVLDRLGQIEPRVLFTADGYYYGGKLFNTLPNAEKIVKGIPSIEKVIVASNITEKSAVESLRKAELYDDIVSSRTAQQIQFEQLPFTHPVYIMFSSGTTGKPKCMVQGVGVLLNELKDTVLHADLRPEDRITYITSASWMMWNWLVSALGAGATIVLYDGNPNYPDWTTMWKLIRDEEIGIFGCSATYINHLRNLGVQPKNACDLSALKEISQTGSPLSAQGFEWVYQEVKEDLFFNSISGGTDLNGGFAGGSPVLPVFAGELASPYLGMKVAAYDEKGNPVLDQEGELVCEAPFPSMPLYFWNDPGDEKYKEAYFNYYRPLGKNVWRHGDYIIVHSDTHGLTFLGRSDSTLKPSGVRIGTAEIYAVIEGMPEIADSLAVGQNWEGDQRIILFVKLAAGYTLTEELKLKIKRTLREKASPRHVPAVILEAPSIPYTFNMKKVESAVRSIIDGKPVTNRDALTNPESLEYFEKMRQGLQKG